MKKPNQNEILFKPTVKQYEALTYLLDDKTDEVLYGGSAGGGKSYLGTAWLIISCLKYPESRWLMGRAKLDTLKKTTLRTFFECSKHFGLTSGVDYNYNGQSNTIIFTNKSEILLKDLYHYPADPMFDSLGSLEIAGAFIDEVAQISGMAREIVKSRLGWKMSDGTEIKPKLYMSCNPCKNWAYRDFYQPHSKAILKDTLKFIPALPSSNKYLSEGRQQSLSNLTGIERKRLLLGMWEFTSDESSLIEYDAIINIFTNEQVLANTEVVISKLSGATMKKEELGTKRNDGTFFKEWAITVDVARLGSDNTVILVWSGLHVVEYKVISKQTTDAVAKIIKGYQQFYNITRTNVIIDADGVGGGLVDQLPGCISFLNGSSPMRKENYLNLKSQCYFKLAECINLNEIYFPVEDDQVMTAIIEELEQVKRKDIDKDGKLAVIPKEQVKAILGRSPDFSDAMAFRMLPLVSHKSQNFDDSYSWAM
jgi:phage terminase large subunit